LAVKVLSVFVVLGNWTVQGIRNIRDAPKRAKNGKSHKVNCGENTLLITRNNNTERNELKIKLFFITI